MPAANLSDLDDRVAHFVALKMAKPNRRRRKEAKAALSRDDDTDSQWEDYDLSSDSVVSDLDTMFGLT